MSQPQQSQPLQSQPQPAAPSLGELAAVLGCSKAVACRLRAGVYARPGSDLLPRYHALDALLQRLRHHHHSVHALCFSCPRQDCSGCRVAEVTQ